MWENIKREQLWVKYYNFSFTFAKCCLFQVLLWGSDSRDATTAPQGCLRCSGVSCQSPAAGPSCVAIFVPWLSASRRSFVYLKQHECPLFGHLNCSLSLDIARMSVAATHNSPHQRTGKDQEARRLVSLALLSISANYFNSAVKCKRRQMHYGVGKRSGRQSQRLHAAKNRSQPQPSAPLRKKSHCSCGSVSHASLLSTTRNPREAGQRDKAMQPRCPVYLLGGEKRGCCWLQMKMWFSTTVLSGGFIVFTHHYWLATCPGIYCVCFRKLRVSTFPSFLTVKTIWSPMGQLDLQCYSAVTSILPRHFM